MNAQKINVAMDKFPPLSSSFHTTARCGARRRTLARCTARARNEEGTESPEPETARCLTRET